MKCLPAGWSRSCNSFSVRWRSPTNKLSSRPVRKRYEPMFVFRKVLQAVIHAWSSYILTVFVPPGLGSWQDWGRNTHILSITSSKTVAPSNERIVLLDFSHRLVSSFEQVTNFWCCCRNDLKHWHTESETKMSMLIYWQSFDRCVIEFHQVPSHNQFGIWLCITGTIKTKCIHLHCSKLASKWSDYLKQLSFTNPYCTWRACTASIHWVRSNSDDKKNVYVRAAERFPTRKTKLGDASTSCASRSASFFRCLSEPRLPSFERCQIDNKKNKIWYFFSKAF